MNTAVWLVFGATLIGWAYAAAELYMLRRIVRENLIVTHGSLRGLSDITSTHSAQIESVYGELHELWEAVTDDEDLDDEDLGDEDEDEPLDN